VFRVHIYEARRFSFQKPFVTSCEFIKYAIAVGFTVYVILVAHREQVVVINIKPRPATMSKQRSTLSKEFSTCSIRQCRCDIVVGVDGALVLMRRVTHVRSVQ